MSKTNNDEKIKALLETIAKKRQELGDRPRIVYKTNGIFKYGDGSFFNINTIVDPQKLVEALAHITSKEQTLASAAEILGVKAEALNWGGFTVDEWTQDFRSRISLIKWEAKKKELEVSEQKLKKLVSEDTRTAMEIDEIANLLG